MKIFHKLWTDQNGAVISIELVLIATVAVIGLVVGLTTLRNSVTNELADVAGSVDNLNQGFGYAGIDGHFSAVAGSVHNDLFDFCDDADDTASAADQCVDHDGAATDPITENTALPLTNNP